MLVGVGRLQWCTNCFFILLLFNEKFKAWREQNNISQFSHPLFSFNLKEKCVYFNTAHVRVDHHCRQWCCVPTVRLFLQALGCNSPVWRLLLEGSAPTTTISTLGVRGIFLFVILSLKGELTLWTLLQAVQIMVGLFNVGLADTHTSHAASSLASVGVGIWLGALVSITLTPG